jgi:hypothetical protein
VKTRGRVFDCNEGQRFSEPRTLMMMSNKNSYAHLNHAIIKIPGPLNSPREGWKRESLLLHALDVKNRSRRLAGRYYQVTVPLVRLDFPMQGLGDLNWACAFRQTR